MCFKLPYLYAILLEHIFGTYADEKLKRHFISTVIIHAVKKASEMDFIKIKKFRDYYLFTKMQIINNDF